LNGKLWKTSNRGNELAVFLPRKMMVQINLQLLIK
jgi:antitoxin component of MazEF toxin-antitoxin module